LADPVLPGNGAGPRFCVGAALARAEAVATIHALLEQVSEITWNPDVEPPQFMGHMPRSHRPLNVLLVRQESLSAH
jgi:cytochrome P450